jgi:hypothetical protein
MFLLRYAKVAQPLCELPELRKMDHRLVAVRATNKTANVGSSRHCLCNLAISQPPQSNMPRDLRDMPKSAPSLSKICRIWRTCFYIEGCDTVQTVALKWPIFKQKKGCATISLGLNYCSMGSVQPPSCDTVPLSLFKNQDKARRCTVKKAYKSLLAKEKMNR